MTLIRKATFDDIPVLVDFQQKLAQESESVTLDEKVLTKGLTAMMADPSRGFYNVAIYNGEVAGCHMITFEWSDWRNRMVWWIQSVYVAPTARGRGVFRALYEHAKREAQAQGAGGLRLYVDVTNRRAQAVYAALGMKGDHYRVFEDMFRELARIG